MKLIPYYLFVYINFAIGLASSVLPWIIEPAAPISIKIAFTLLGLIQIVFCLLSKDKKFSYLEVISSKYVTLAIFCVSVVINFIPYLTSSSSFINLVKLAIGASILSLLLIIFSNVENKIKD